MKLHLITLIALAGTAMLQPACTSAERQRQYAEAAEQAEACVAQFRQAVAKSTCAKVRKLPAGSDTVQEYTVPPEEFALLREIMLHTAAAAPALETDAPGWPEHFPYVVELVFADARGGELTGIVINHRRWMSRSEAKKLRPQVSRPWDTPDWYLPDRDYAALAKLPAMQWRQKLAGAQASQP